MEGRELYPGVVADSREDGDDAMNEKLWNEVELFEWNGKMSIREKATKHPIVYLWDAVIDGHEYWWMKKLREQVAPRIVELMNQQIAQGDPVTVPDLPEISNGSNIESNPEPLKRLGNPAFQKGKPNPYMVKK